MSIDESIAGVLDVASSSVGVCWLLAVGNSFRDAPHGRLCAAGGERESERDADTSRASHHFDPDLSGAAPPPSLRSPNESELECIE